MILAIKTNNAINAGALHEALTQEFGDRYTTYALHESAETGNTLSLTVPDDLSADDAERLRVFVAAHDPLALTTAQSSAQASRAARQTFFDTLDAAAKDFEQPLDDDVANELATLRASYAHLLRALAPILERHLTT